MKEDKEVDAIIKDKMTLSDYRTLGEFVFHRKISRIKTKFKGVFKRE